jgi:hypothetical protein
MPSCDTRRVTCHLSCTHDVSHVTCLVHTTCHMSPFLVHATCHMSPFLVHATCHMSPVLYTRRVTCHLSCTCHMSPVLYLQFDFALRSHMHRIFMNVCMHTVAAQGVGSGECIQTHIHTNVQNRLTSCAHIYTDAYAHNADRLTSRECHKIKLSRSSRTVLISMSTCTKLSATIRCHMSRYVCTYA